MNRCRICGQTSVVDLVDFGHQPIANRYVSETGQTGDLFPSRLGLCGDCGVVQSLCPIPIEEVRPRLDWITYREPEGHLDELVKSVRALPGVTSESTIRGLTFKDDSTLERMKTLGARDVARLDPSLHLGVTESNAGLETIQDRFKPDVARSVEKILGSADVLFIRHVLEHAYDPGIFLDAARELLSTDGYLVLEVPSNSSVFEQGIHAAVWEEHVTYFTAQTFRWALPLLGWEIYSFYEFEYSMENSLVAIVRPRNRLTVPSSDMVLPAIQEARRFADGFESQRNLVKNSVSRLRADHGPIALLGAGHLGGAYIELYELGDLLEFVVDDDPDKQRVYMPGSGLPILGSSALLEEQIAVCLLCVSPEAAEQIEAKNQQFIQYGGRFIHVLSVGGGFGV